MNKDIFKEKQKLRALVRQGKNKMSPEEKQHASEGIFKEIEGMDVFHFAQTIMVYWSLPDEVNTRNFILKWYQEKTLLLPVIRGGDIYPVQFTGPGDMVSAGPYSIPEPSGGNFTETDKIDLIIIPGMAFDHENNRLGRGKAFYDRFLPKTRAYRLGVCYRKHHFEKIPATENDIKMDRVVSR
ncbi:MAG: 5-formyltetrahydrofolate cyclo-ligase [Bacteroidales bacterium]|nr:5-formyltetrahydrofolate cyclo-ligase [Bacteroidales bacterium]